MSWSLGSENDFTQRKRLFGWYQRWFQLHAVDMAHLLLNLCLQSSHAVASTFLGLDLCPSCPHSVCAHNGLAAHPRTHAAGWRSACSQRWEANFTRVQMNTGNRFWLASCSMLPMPVSGLFSIVTWIISRLNQSESELLPISTKKIFTCFTLRKICGGEWVSNWMLSNNFLRCDDCTCCHALPYRQAHVQ